MLPGLGFAAAGAPAGVEPQRIEVIGTTPLSGASLPMDRIPANVQIIKTADAAGRRASSLAELLNAAAGGVSINDTAGNSYQPDLNFRGFTASPALGTPQGLSVFVDGVRVNEVFGDTVNWDLIPSAAIAKVTVIPGSDPVFGRNTLGGALTVTTKTGFDSPGLKAQANWGSFGRRAAEFEVGAHSDALAGYATGHALRDAGWGAHNPSRIQQLFGSGSFHDERNEAAITVTLADNRLEGSQTLPLSFLDMPRQSYTWPDVQTNRLVFVSARLSHSLPDSLLVVANAYWRHVSSHVINSNVNNGFDSTRDPGPGNQPTGNAINRINQTRPGVSLQLSSAANLFGHTNLWTLGWAFDGGRTGFTQSDQEAGASRETQSAAPALLVTSLRSTAAATGLYVSDTLGIGPATFLTVSGRREQARVKLEDRIGTALNGDHAFRRFNPGIGLTHLARPGLTVYASYNEGLRVPTPVELSCADPNAPCSLPNAFASDPALRPVVSRTLEVGARGTLDRGPSWSAAIFRTTLADDIQFISSGGGATHAGYFQNVGQTRRQGWELGLQGSPLARLNLELHYSAIDARFQTPLILNSPNNSTAGPVSCASCSDIAVRRGDRLPAIPRHIVKLGAQTLLTQGTSIELNMLAQSGIYARGDENNRDANGPLPAFALFNLNAQHRFAPGWELWLKLNNLFDRRYSTFGALGQNVFTGPDHRFDPTGRRWRSEQFRTVAAPRGIWLGWAYRIGERAD